MIVVSQTFDELLRIDGLKYQLSHFAGFYVCVIFKDGKEVSREHHVQLHQACLQATRAYFSRHVDVTG